MKRSTQLIGLFLLAAAAALLLRSPIYNTYVEWRKPAVPSEQPRPTTTATPIVGSPRPSPTPMPAGGAINLAVPFHAQAPRGDWSLPWQEACEESSAILVDAFWNDEDLTVAEMETRIQALVQWQQNNLGYYFHTDAATTARMIREVYGYRRVEVEYGITIDDIAEHVRASRPVIVPLAGRLLGNPYYTSPGPVYHMLVVKGIAENGDIITNDVGTRHGRNLTYAPDVFYNAIHDAPSNGDDWPTGVDPADYILTGRKAIVVVYPN